MSEKVLHLGHGFCLPADEFIETKFGVIGQSGRGKTGLVRRTLEECHRVNLPFIVMDPSGILWGLRSSFDGKGPGLPGVVVFGGDHADVPLVRAAGADVARAVVAANISCVIDLSNESKATYRQFAKDFAETLFAINDSPRFLVLDEAPELVPQSLAGRPDLAATYDAIERLVRQGRNKGIGVMLVSQRAATISKDVLTQCGSLFVFGLVGTPDRKALREWVQAFGSEAQLREFEEGLAQLDVRECWFWSPSQFKEFRRIRVLDFHTFHPDRTHLRRIGMLAGKAVTTDVSAIVTKLGAQMERIVKEKVDVAQVPRLHAEVGRLRRELEAAKTRPATSTVDVAKAVREAEAPLRSRISELARHISSDEKLRASIRRDIASIVQSLDRSNGHTAVIAAPPSPARVVVASPPPRREDPPLARRTRVDDSGDAREVPLPTGGALRMIRALAGWHPETLSRIDLGVVAEIAPNSGTFSDYLSLLRRNGFIEERSDGTIGATKEGLEFATGASRLAPEAIQRSALARVSGGARRMLDHLIRAHPDAITRYALGEAAEVAPNSGTFSDYLSMLRRLGFIETQGQTVLAREVLFA